MEILKNNPNISNINEFNNNSPMGTEDGKTQIYRYIRLTELIKILQEKVNNEIYESTSRTDDFLHHI